MNPFERARRLVAPASPPSEPITLRPVGVVRSTNRDLRPRDVTREQALIELYAEYAPALLGLAGFSHMIVLTWLDRVSEEERETLREQLGGRIAIGVFALRTHHRPNPIGLTVVRINGVMKRSVEVIGLDAIDGTPVLDLKPYLPPYDAVADASLPDWATDARG